MAKIATRRSAKPLCVGASPTVALLWNDWITGNAESGKISAFQFPASSFPACPGGGTGIRARLKIVSRMGCGFDPHPGQKIYREEEPPVYVLESENF